MILNTKLTIAYKNDTNFYNVEYIDIFRFKNVELSTLYKLSIYKRKEFVVRCKCPLCGNFHSYRWNIYSVLNGKVAIGGCSIVGEPVIIIGNNKDVMEIVNKYKEINTRILALK